MNRRRFLSLSAAFACAPHLAVADQWRGIALGADASVSLSGPRENVAAALARIPAWLDAIEQEFSLYRPDSTVSRLNQQGTVTAGPVFLSLLAQVSEVHGLTQGLFDPTVQAYYSALTKGLSRDTARALVGWQHVTRTRSGEITLGTEQSLTLNGIAQGYATDVIRTRLAKLGFDQALVNIGEQAALNGPFRLGLVDPQHGFVGQQTIQSEAIATSSPGATLINGQPHIFAPDGRPALWSTISMTGPSATWADGLSTAGVFMDLAQLKDLKALANLRRVTVVDTNGRLLSI